MCRVLLLLAKATTSILLLLSLAPLDQCRRAGDWLSWKPENVAKKLIVLRYPYKTELLKNRRERDFDLHSFPKQKVFLYLDPYNEMLVAGEKKYTSFYLLGKGITHPAKEGKCIYTYERTAKLSDDELV